MGVSFPGNHDDSPQLPTTPRPSPAGRRRSLVVIGDCSTLTVPGQRGKETVWGDPQFKTGRCTSRQSCSPTSKLVGVCLVKRLTF